MKIELKLDKRHLSANGYPIKIYVYLKKGSEKWIPTDHYTFLEQFNLEAFEPNRKHPNFLFLYEWIATKKVELMKMKNSAIAESWSLQKIENTLKKDNSESFLKFGKELAKEYKLLGRKVHVAYSANLSLLEDYKSEINFSDIDYNFIISYRDFKLLNGCTNNGVNAYLRILRAIYNEAIRREDFIPKSFKSPFLGVMKKNEKTKDKNFSVDEMKIVLKNFNSKKLLENPKTKEKEYHYLNYFMLCFYLGGIDFVDIANLKYSEHVKKGRVVFKRFKGGSTYEWINNKIFPQAQEILDIYKDDSDYLTNCWQKSDYDNLRKNYNYFLKKWIKSIEIESYFTTKTPRYTFIDIGKKMELNRDVIMELTGHTRKDIHSIYEGDFLDATQDEVHKKIINSIH